MAPVILKEKLESLRRCLQRVEDKTPPEIETLMGDPDIQDILILNLTRAVQLCVGIGSHIISESDRAAPAAMGDLFTTLNKLDAITEATCESMKKAVGFRNVAVHNYGVINWKIVFAVCEKSLPDFQRFAGEIDGYSRKGLTAMPVMKDVVA